MYTIKEAALRSGLSPAVIRAWERRYGIVRPARSPSGYRLYDEAAVARLRTMRRLVGAGWLPSLAARAIEAGEVAVDIGEPSSPAAGDSSPIALRTPAAASGLEAARRDLIKRFVAAAAAHDNEAVETILDEIGGIGRFEVIVDDFLLPAAAALGDAWAKGILDVGAEHAASAAVHRRLSAAFQTAGGDRGGPPLLVGLPAGSRHELGALAFAVAARRLGLNVVYLGPDVPTYGWLAATRSTKAWLVVLGVVSPSDRDPAIETVRAINADQPHVLVALGGQSAPEPPAAEGRSWVRLPDRVVDAARFAAALWRERETHLP